MGIVLLGCAGSAGRMPPREGGPSSTARLDLGPMVGHVTDTTVRIWVDVDRDGVLGVTLTDPRGGAVKSETRIAWSGDGITLVDLAGLEPSTAYTPRFTLDGAPLPIDPPLAFRTFPRPGAPARIRIAFVSCARVPWDSIQPAWSAVAADGPDAIVWLGDNGYLEHEDSNRPADYASAERIEFRYREMRGLPSVQPVLRSMANYAIWDDRDYGDSDSDRTNPFRDEVAEIFERYWANATYGQRPGLDGIYSTFRVGDAQVFLLDDRFWRDPDTLPDNPSKTVLGAEQKAWLKDALVTSDALLKVIAIGHQVLVDYHEWESYAMFAHERQELLDWIRDRRIEGVVFVDGDRHLSELMRAEPEGLYPIYELTASPIGNRPFSAGLELPNPIRIAGYSAGDSYGILDLDSTVSPATLTFLVKDAAGNEVVRQELAVEELRFRDPAP